MQTPDDLVKGLLVFFKYTLLPAESFFHTVLRNSKFCNTYVDNNLHVTNWKRKLGCKCQYKHIVDWCGCSPNDFRPDDWQRIQNTESRQLFFARKFEPIVSQSIILQLEMWLYSLESPRFVLNLFSYWHSIYHYLDLSPPADDSLLTIAESGARFKSKFLSTTSCKIQPLDITEITSYHSNDTYRATLIAFEANTSDSQISTLEVAIKPKKLFKVVHDSTLAKRIRHLRVSTEYDQKEQIFRNFLNVMGPYSEPTLLYLVDSSVDTNVKIVNLSVLWIDPAGRLVDVNEISIDHDYLIGHLKLSQKPPLLPGGWTVKLVFKKHILAETKFLITPLVYYSNRRIKQSEADFVHQLTNYNRDLDSQFDMSLPNSSERKSLEDISIKNSLRFGDSLIEWVDDLFTKFFSVGLICSVDTNVVCGKEIQSCWKSTWSSYSPDPKSYVGQLNQTTGSFDLWSQN